MRSRPAFTVNVHPVSISALRKRGGGKVLCRILTIRRGLSNYLPSSVFATATPWPESRRQCPAPQGTPILARPKLAFRRASSCRFSPSQASTLAPNVSTCQAFVSVYDMSAHPRLCIASWRVPGWPVSFCRFSGCPEQGVSRSSYVFLAIFTCADPARPHSSFRPRHPLLSQPVSLAWRPVFFLATSFFLVPVSISRVASCTSRLSSAVSCTASSLQQLARGVRTHR